MSIAIEVKDLRVDYGSFVAVRDFSLAVPRGEILGLVGPNGAGKTSTFRVLATLMEPTYGEVKLAGVDIFREPEKARHVLGYMPDLAPVPKDLKVWEMLDYYAQCYGYQNKGQRRERIAQCLELTRMTENQGSWCHQLSRGQTQRIILAKTLLHRPEILILDEPASGLDPLSRRQLRQIVQELAAGGTTILVSSHILAELAEMCTSLCVMAKGRKLADGPVEYVRDQLGRAERILRLRLMEGAPACREWLVENGRALGVISVQEPAEPRDEILLTFGEGQQAQAALLSRLIQAGFVLSLFEERHSSFEDILVDIAQRSDPEPIEL